MKDSTPQEITSPRALLESIRDTTRPSELFHNLLLVAIAGNPERARNQAFSAAGLNVPPELSDRFRCGLYDPNPAQHRWPIPEDPEFEVRRGPEPSGPTVEVFFVEVEPKTGVAQAFLALTRGVLGEVGLCTYEWTGNAKLGTQDVIDHCGFLQSEGHRSYKFKDGQFTQTCA